MKTMTNKILTIIAAVSLTCFFVSCGGDTQSQQTQTPNTQKTEQQAAQPTDSKTISFEAYDIKGTLRQSSEWIGKQPVVINIWGTWCPPCRAEIPAFVKAYDIYNKKGVEFLGIAVKDTPDKVSAFSSQNNMNWEMMMISEQLVRRFKIQSVPTTIFIDRNGKVMEIFNPRTNSITETFSGAMHYEQFTGYLDSLLTI